MSKLTNNIREKMAEALVRHRYDARAKELTDESAAIFIAAYEHHYDEKTREHMRDLQRKHKNAFDKRSAVDVNANGPSFTVGNQQIGRRGRSGNQDLPFLRDMQGYRSNISLLDAPELSQRAIEHAQVVEKFEEEVQTAYNEALGTLRQFNSGKQLATDWPEALPIIGALIPQDNRTLPVIQVKELNDRFGLPVVEKKKGRG